MALTRARPARSCAGAQKVKQELAAAKAEVRVLTGELAAAKKELATAEVMKELSVASAVAKASLDLQEVASKKFLEGQQSAITQFKELKSLL